MESPHAKPAGGQGWNGLIIAPREPRRPLLRWEVAGGRRLMLQQAGRPVMFATVDGDHGGVGFYRTGDYRSPIPHLRAAHARDIAEGDPAARESRWAHYFARVLTEGADGPLHEGTWTLTSRVDRLRGSSRNPARRWRHTIAAGDPDGYLDWFRCGGRSCVVPLTRLPEHGDDRVKAYRRQVRDRTLPPVLLWWISGLDSYVILDGHRRLIAALAEDQEPPLLALSHTRGTTADLDRTVRRYRDTMRHLQALVSAEVPGSGQAVSEAAVTLADGLHSPHPYADRTRAWQLPGGESAWRQAANGHLQ